jgi:hypothetical protein
MFKSASRMMEGRSGNSIEDRQGWYNQFRLQVTNKINEELFKPLFSAENGAPNVPMMILKEGQGISDEQLFESARFNMLTRSALGLLNIDDEPPVESTYYLLRQRIVEYEKTNGENLLDSMFKELTKEQSIEFGVSGKRIRMDSKLLGSNIAYRILPVLLINVINFTKISKMYSCEIVCIKVIMPFHPVCKSLLGCFPDIK